MVLSSRIGVVLAACLGLALTTALAARTAQEKAPLPAATQRPKAGLPPSVQPKVLQLVFDPPVESEGGKRLHEVMHWNDPEQLSKDYAADLKECSGGYADYRIVETLHVDEYPPQRDG